MARIPQPSNSSARPSLSRRELLERVGTGVGALGLAAVMQDAGLLAAPTPGGSGQETNAVHGPPSPLAPKKPHLAPRAKRVIHLLMNGGVSHVDTFDYKPILKKYSGQRPAAVDLQTDRITEGLMPSPWEFHRHGRSGLWVSELQQFPARCL